jgi:serine/threonine-protein kinase
MASVWGELKRRNVVRVAVAYAIVAWLLIQVVATVLPVFESPVWIARVFTFFVVLGFPIAVVIAWAYELTPDGIERTSSVPASESITRRTGRKLNFVTVGALALALVFVVYNYVLVAPETDIPASGIVSEFNASRSTSQDEPPESVRRFAIELGEIDQMGAAGGSAVRSEIAISPDGKNLVFVASTEGNTASQLFVRALDQLDAQVIPGTEAARHPFFSPDGDWIGFDIGTQLQKVSVRGGLQKTLTEGIRRMPGATWSENDTIVFSTTAGANNVSFKLVSVSANGGVAEDILVPDERNTFKWPHFLPGGEFLLFTISDIGGNTSDGSIGLLDLASGQHRTLIAGAYNAKYAPTGHIVFARGDALWAVPFDLNSMQINGAESPLFDEIEHNKRTGDVIYDFTDDGSLVYLFGGDRGVGIPNQKVAVWVDRQGNEEPIGIPPADYWLPRISPDGSRAVAVVFDANGSDLWTIDLERETSGRLTFGADTNAWPVWSPDGSRIIYTSGIDGGGIFERAANGTGSPTLINRNSVAISVQAVSPDGQRLVVVDSIQGESDIFHLSTEGEAYPLPFVDTDYDEDYAELSPDGKFIAYRSNETDRNEVYVRTFPNPDDGRWQISVNGGADPRWNPDGTELFFRKQDSASLFAVDVPTDPDFSWDEPRLLVSRDYNNGSGNYAVAADGERFLMFRPADGAEDDASDATAARLAIVENWFTELERVAPAVE